MGGEFTLTEDQPAAHKSAIQFLMHPDQTVMVIKGFSGVGKTTLVSHIIIEIPATLKLAKLITNDEHEWEVIFTATTNKAAEAFHQITGEDVRTIHSFIGARSTHRSGLPACAIRVEKCDSLQSASNQGK